VYKPKPKPNYITHSISKFRISLSHAKDIASIIPLPYSSSVLVDLPNSSSSGLHACKVHDFLPTDIVSFFNRKK